MSDLAASASADRALGALLMARRARRELAREVPDRRYDAVFFGFWISHVPEEKFASFWSLVAEALEPGGRVFFFDDNHRTETELIEGVNSAVVQPTE